mgnify:CR=1 FL=1
MEQKFVLAVVGLPGAGKTEAVNYILQKTGLPKVYLGDVTLDALRAKGLPFTQENERPVREEIRARHGMGAYALLSLPKIRQFYETSSVIIESMYSWEEYLIFRQEFGNNFKVLAIYASPATRTQRMAVRPERPLTEEELIARDFAQIEKLNQAGPIARADWTIINEGSSEDLHSEIDNILEKCKNY